MDKLILSILIGLSLIIYYFNILFIIDRVIKNKVHLEAWSPKLKVVH